MASFVVCVSHPALARRYAWHLARAADGAVAPAAHTFFLQAAPLEHAVPELLCGARCTTAFCCQIGRISMERDGEKIVGSSLNADPQFFCDFWSVDRCSDTGLFLLVRSFVSGPLSHEMAMDTRDALPNVERCMCGRNRGVARRTESAHRIFSQLQWESRADDFT